MEADTIIVHSRQALEAAEAEWPHLARRFVRGLRGVDLRAGLSQPMDPARVKKLRDGWGVRPHERLVVGLDLPPDRQKFFLLAAAQLAKRNFFDNEAQEVRFVWRDAEGADLTSGPFEAEARQLGLDRHVLRVAGGDPAAACLASALVATPAADARLSVEAQALGAPTAVLQSAADQYVETVLAPPQVDSAKRTGWIIAPDQPSAFARAAEEALRLGASAREKLALARGRACARLFRRAHERADAFDLRAPLSRVTI